MKMQNRFEKIGIGDEDVRRRIDSCFETIFFDPEERFYREVDPDSACMVDTGNLDARTEGMSYGMMMCVQMDRRDLFDKLWQFSKRYMFHESGKYAGYFAWSVDLDGKHNAEGPAPDGEEYYAMALFFAAARWGSGTGIFDYEAEAREILRHCVHQPELVPGGRAMWDERNCLIRFVPEADFTDPSYHLPHFYDLFAEKADPQDRDFWKKAAEESRKYIIRSAHPV
ncbi:MAG: xylanase, partial [Clostridia bacterium]|nr:xylanase [Clostridia bacterium]